ncbi:MAG TPA: hypothetical protein VM427_06895 [Patescibacteria group bacterium]|nr:hypothetical protein [Patescibacteria group bacterium]
MDRAKRWWSGLSLRGKAIVVVVVAVLAAIAGANPGKPASTETAGASPRVSQAPASPSSASSPAASASPAGSESAVPTEGPAKPIPGLSAVDVTVSLEGRGFDCTGPDISDSGVIYNCKLVAPDAEQRVIVLGATPTSIGLVDATALDYGANPGDTGKAFLQYMASIPCTGCDPAAAQKWVRETFDDGGEQVIGPLILVMYGDARGKILEIRAAP